MAAKKSVSVVRGSNWEGVYINGQLVAEGWVLQLNDFEKILKSFNITVNVVNHDDNWLKKTTLPKKMKDVRRKNNKK
jgi:hypothetical protein